MLKKMKMIIIDFLKMILYILRMFVSILKMIMP